MASMMMKGMTKFASRGRYQAPADFDVKKSVDNDTAARMAQQSRHPLHKMHQAGIRIMPLSSKKMIVSFLLPAFTAVVFPVAVASRRLRGRMLRAPKENSTILDSDNFPMLSSKSSDKKQTKGPFRKSAAHEDSESKLVFQGLSSGTTEDAQPTWLEREQSSNSFPWTTKMSFRPARRGGWSRTGPQEKKRKQEKCEGTASRPIIPLRSGCTPDATPKAARASSGPVLSLEDFVESVKAAQTWASPSDPVYKVDDLGRRFFVPFFPAEFSVAHHLTPRTMICECILQLSTYLCKLDEESKEDADLTRALRHLMEQDWVRKAWEKIAAWNAEENQKHPYDTKMFAYHALLWAPGNLVLGKETWWAESNEEGEITMTEIKSETEDDPFRIKRQQETGRIQLPLPERTHIEKIYGQSGVELHRTIWEMVVQAHWSEKRVEDVQDRLMALPEQTTHEQFGMAELVQKRISADVVRKRWGAEQEKSLVAFVAALPALQQVLSLKFVQTMTELSKLHVDEKYASSIGWACGLREEEASCGWDGEKGEEVSWARWKCGGSWHVERSTGTVIEDPGRKKVTKSHSTAIEILGIPVRTVIEPPRHANSSFAERLKEGLAVFPKLSTAEPLRFLVGRNYGTHVQTPAARGRRSGAGEHKPRKSPSSSKELRLTEALMPDPAAAPDSPTSHTGWGSVRESFSTFWAHSRPRSYPDESESS